MMQRSCAIDGGIITGAATEGDPFSGGSSVRDAFTQYVFVGPFAEWLSPTIVHMPEDEDDPDGWNEMIDSGVLYWNISYGTATPPQVERRRKQFYQYCCGPQAKRRKQPRENMLLILNADNQPPLAVSWANVNAQQEIAWFTTAFRKELAKLTLLFGQPPRLDWGLVYMWS